MLLTDVLLPQPLLAVFSHRLTVLPSHRPTAAAATTTSADFAQLLAKEEELRSKSVLEVRGELAMKHSEHDEQLAQLTTATAEELREVRSEFTEQTVAQEERLEELAASTTLNHAEHGEKIEAAKVLVNTNEQRATAALATLREELVLRMDERMANDKEHHVSQLNSHKEEHAGHVSQERERERGERVSGSASSPPPPTTHHQLQSHREEHEQQLRSHREEHEQQLRSHSEEHEAKRTEAHAALTEVSVVEGSESPLRSTTDSFQLTFERSS